MADNKGVGAPALDTNIESGNFDEKKHQQEGKPAAPAPKEASGSDEEEDEDMDALIEDLESEDGHGADEEEEEENTPGGGRVVPEDMLQTDSRVGLTESEVTTRRRKYGLNQMKEEKENLILKFFGYFVGPIQFVMEVSLFISSCFLLVMLDAFRFPPPIALSSCSLFFFWLYTKKQQKIMCSTNAMALAFEDRCFGKTQWLALQVRICGFVW